MTEIEKIPAHVAIIMDGNGRWAQQRGQERAFGHIQGVESVREIIKAAVEYKVKYLTLYTFSTENWGRPQEEVEMLMELLCKSVVNECDELIREGAKVKIIGDRRKISQKVNEHLDIIEERTANGESITILLAINYSSRSEITHAIEKITADVSAGKIKLTDISETTVCNALYTGDFPDPDLIIRTGGEQRLSNFMLWQGAYSELYFTSVFWPDFGKEDFFKALQSYASRQRRFGLVDDQN